MARFCLCLATLGGGAALLPAPPESPRLGACLPAPLGGVYPPSAPQRTFVSFSGCGVCFLSASLAGLDGVASERSGEDRGRIGG